MPFALRSLRISAFAGALLASCAPPAPAETPHDPAPARAAATPRPSPAALASATPTSPPPAATSQAVLTSATPSATPSASPAAEVPRAAWSECRVEPPPPHKTPGPASACINVASSLDKALRPKLTKTYEPTATGAKLVITFPCDPLGKVRDILYESGSGHGQNLQLIRLRIHDGSLSALRITKPGVFDTAASGPTVDRAEIDGRAFQAHLPELRALTLAKLEERVPPDPPEISGSFSSNDWHGLLRIEDEAGLSIERSFTGYQSSSAQLKTIPLGQIGEVLYPILEAIPWQSAPADADARAFFVERALAADLPKAEWWVKERLVELAAAFGTPALVPTLVDLALDARRDASVQRTRVHAVNALAALAGFDARHDAKGALLPVDDVAAAYARACRRPPR